MSYNKCLQHKTIMYLLLSKTFNIPFVEKETAINYSLGHCNSFLFFFLFFCWLQYILNLAQYIQKCEVNGYDSSKKYSS